MRTAEIKRKTKETDIEVFMRLDGEGRVSVDTGIGFFDHMLTALGVHSGMDLEVRCTGDLNVDGHHTVEDVGICIGKAIAEALGDKAGIARYGSAFVPMDEALCFCSLDISGRPFLAFNAQFTDFRCGEYDTCLTEEFFRALAVNSGITLHLREEYGKNDHHIIEAMFKAFAHALKDAMSKTGGGVLSTKGVL
ncbi:imidazoleglycerol-phosphate dehydratase [Ruminococcus sp. YE71]|uniref:imidazoleglycerol-phosphate dehydratase HisB n=1 Tax=unclassified Ruminococcus TaxID=2608920 RepID=UPI00088AA836|nr:MULTISPECIES: imidazoleglycerol-phosphate dehydratase HisB [unclassified Ruminococcus]SDA20930.1 imidazoleglycerol-phosphate dehydratase [Ruminococcus sp. YE78]SFW33330.1 imidazoleglycerol-phosphate dehydratase [Ruminococcus sp. YE71]